MSKNLLIVESPSKIQKIKGFLDNTYIVSASKGHIRDLDSKSLSIDTDNDFQPTYILSESKKFIIQELKAKIKQCQMVWLASDCDREGESIAWHISEVLKLKPEKRKRIVFTEITKKAILAAISNPKDIDMNLFYAQQARRILDRLIGYLISPILWKQIHSANKKKISLSAGRVQSVVLRLVLEREREIQKFQSESYFKINGTFQSSKNVVKADLDENIENKADVEYLLDYCKTCKFTVSDVTSKKSTRKPSAPFTTSTLQQEASIKFKMSPKVTMKVAQQLYESGYITYMRTDSVALSDDAIRMIKDTITKDYGEKYLKVTTYKNKSQNSQEAHEACRPCKFDLKTLDDETMDNNEKKLYKLIWNRTVASQMQPAKVEILTTKIDIGESDYKFISKQERIIFDGFQRLYQISTEETESDSESDSEKTNKIKKLKVGDILKYQTINAIQKYSRPPHARYTEASLVKKLDDMGIGRPSTYSSMVSLIQDRNYVNKKDLEGKEVDYSIFKLYNNILEEKIGKTKIDGDKQKLIPTDIGTIVVDFLVKHFDGIMDYQFTANVEAQLDDIAAGTKNWVDVVKSVYQIFHPNVVSLTKTEIKEKDKFHRSLGMDPASKMEVFTYIGKYGPLVKLADTNGKDKFAPLKDIKITDVTLEQALQLLKYPYDLGKYLDKTISMHIGKYGKYLKYDGKNFTCDEDINLESAIQRITQTHPEKQNNIIKIINDKISIKNGKYGPYISYKNKLNVKIYGPKKPEELTLQDCINLINKKKKIN